jgi:hypothetical protein
MFMSREYNEGQNRDLKQGNKSYTIEANFKYLTKIILTIILFMKK